jgi:hypothetical protein
MEANKTASNCALSANAMSSDRSGVFILDCTCPFGEAAEGSGWALIAPGNDQTKMRRFEIRAICNRRAMSVSQ